MSWRALATMTVSLLFGAFFAIGHHFFYASLNGHAVTQNRLQQETYVAIGVAFAYLVRASLLIAVGIAFTQLFWHDILTQTPSIKNIDGLYTLRRNPLGFLDINFSMIFAKHRTLALLALAMWRVFGTQIADLQCLLTTTRTIPVVMIFPPAALTVQPSLAPYPSFTTFDVPMINFTNTLFAETFDPYRFDNTTGRLVTQNITYIGPQGYLKSTFLRSALSGSMLDIPPAIPASNFSYTTEFSAPTLRCENGSQSLLEDVAMALNVSLDGCFLPTWEDAVCPMYIAWSPNATSLVPFDNIKSVMSPANSFATETISFFIGWSTNLWYPRLDEVVNCSLWISKYTVDFRYTNKIQNISVVTSDYVPFGQGFTVISTYTHSADEDNPNIQVETFHNQSSVNYLALMDSLTAVLGGAVYMEYDLPGSAGITKSTSSVLSTSLTRTTNLSKVAAAYSDQTHNSYYDVVEAEQTSNEIHDGVFHFQTLSEAPEELFINSTLSLLQNPLFSFNGNRDYFPRYNNSYKVTTNVTIYNTENEYSYSPTRLVAAYSASIAAAALCVCMGCLAFLRNGIENFSSIFRFTHGVDIDFAIAERDRYGNDPLPDYIAEAKIKPRAGPGPVRLRQKFATRENGVQNAWMCGALLSKTGDDVRGEALPLKLLVSYQDAPTAALGGDVTSYANEEPGQIEIQPVDHSNFGSKTVAEYRQP